VPFGEYRPFRDFIPTPAQLSTGNGKEVITIDTKFGDFVFAPAICYEIIFSDSLVPKGANPHAIINITNDTWFGTTPGVFQHLDMVRRYAIESGLPIIRANYSGISAFVASDGNIESYLSVGQNGSLDGMVWGGHMTPYRFIGRNLWMLFILMFSAIVSISIRAFQKKD
jgi:apolipoprotein N-acyltransferase